MGKFWHGCISVLRKTVIQYYILFTYTWLSAPFTQHSQSTVTVSGLKNTTELHLLCLADQIIAVVLVTVFAHCKVLRIRTHLQYHIWCISTVVVAYFHCVSLWQY